MSPIAARLQEKNCSKVLPSLRSLTISSGLGISSKKKANANNKEESEEGRHDFELYQDIEHVHRALECFYDSRIIEAQQLLLGREGIYVSLGRAFILFLKSMMTFQECDIQETMNALKSTIQLAGSLRKKDGWMESFSSLWQQKNVNTTLQQMTAMERHSELIYAEAYLLKALLSIAHDESVVSFVREGLNIRSSYNTYITLQNYVNFVQQEAAKGKDIQKYGLDEHLISGICLGSGTFNIILSMLPASVIKVVEFIGFTVDRAHGLQVLTSAGGWDDVGKTSRDGGDDLLRPMEGLRRQLCDMVLITYNIVLADLLPLSHVDVELARRILHVNLERYPSGVFFLYFDGRRLVSQGYLEQAKQQYQKAIDTQKDWKQLQHMCYWDLGLIALIQKRWQDSYSIYETLKTESKWSKAVYNYLMAVALYMQLQEADDEKKPTLSKQVQELMQSVPTSKKKVAGKSIPMEKFVSRKAKSYLRDGALIAPDLEILNGFTVFDWMSTDILQTNMTILDTKQASLSDKSSNYYDDLCLVYYLKGLTARCLIMKQPSAELSGLHKVHSDSMDMVFKEAHNVRWDHYVYYFARYEHGRLLLHEQKYAQAEKEIKVVIRSNGYGSIGSGPHNKHKYSLANALQFKCHNCLLRIDQLMNK